MQDDNNIWKLKPSEQANGKYRAKTGPGSLTFWTREQAERFINRAKAEATK